MYKLILILITIPFLGYSQNTERNQKLQKRNDHYYSKSYRTPNNNWRYSSPRVWTPRYYTPFYNPPIYYSPWNSPYIYSPWRSRILDPIPPVINNNNYYYSPNTNSPELPNSQPQSENKPYKPIQHTLGMTFPVNKNYDMSMGVYYSVGRENLFIATYKFPITTIDFYDNISLSDINSWGDRFVKYDKNFSEFTIGYGKRFDNMSPYFGFGLISERIYPRYFDDLYVLGYNGSYNISPMINRSGQIVVGSMFDFEFINLNLSVSLLRVPNVSFGFGFIF
jgi:hypothetical protein